MLEASWRDEETGAVERLRVTTGLEVRASSVIQGGEGAIRYELVLGADWTTRSLELESTAGGTLHVSSDGQGGWEVDGQTRPDLAEAVDLDLAATPFTNTLPIQRLGGALAEGEQLELVVAWVDPSSLELHPDRQVYTRLGPQRWRFASPDSGFERDLEVDEHGLVLDYPGLFTRIGG
ncbi:putative glycolipid-binding domain-containing protein [Homoserinibacter sp. YIM 151385]|uniref:putative glycolipid-binding domain-containing protein n=1 Tax=Homoserinibacter sp. YIM 151385 TaxID=2985506 RepID=UPI0022F00CC7|nr:putative glycolipid-binding domain-containing protein [Homoserinibacter sp. YIM 151385]WBU38411.1 putative glycolipid-binding domain-containing protein [Homoserinibacter sp. YIM 151385]